MADPHAVADKAQRVRAMFAAIAPAYDLNNRLHSLGRDQAWRRAAVRAARIRPGESVLDVACGTGDLALAFARAGAGRVVGVDFTVEMLGFAQRKGAGGGRRGRVAGAESVGSNSDLAPKNRVSEAPEGVQTDCFPSSESAKPQGEADAAPGASRLPPQSPKGIGSHAMVPGAEGDDGSTPGAGGALTPALSLRRERGWAPVFLAGDALRLPIADASFDVVSIAFGIRNVADPAAALREFHRVLKPGGRAVILEFSLPGNRLLRAAYRCYFDHVLPRTAGWIARDRVGAYRYLPRSVGTFVDRQAMLGLMRQAGFGDLTMRVLTLGIAVIYRGVKA